MRVRLLGLSLMMVLPSAAFAQEPGVALNAGRGLDNGMGVNWTFTENWTLRPTVGAGYSQQTGFQARIGSTILRSFGSSHRVYGYIGAGIYAYRGGSGTYINQGQNNPTPAATPVSFTTPYLRTQPNSVYVTTPVGLRGRLWGNFEAFAEAAYQKTLSGEFSTINQTGQFSGDQYQRFGATFGISMRLGR